VASDKIKLSRREDGCFQVRKGSLNAGFAEWAISGREDLLPTKADLD
jgi:hypothetical protein